MRVVSKRSLFFSILVSFWPAIAFADSTDAEQISQINYDASSNDLFFLSTTGTWNASVGNGGASTCQNAPYVHVRPTVSGRQQILAIGLAAYMAGKKVAFLGACSTVANETTQYFDAYYIIIRN